MKRILLITVIAMALAAAALGNASNAAADNYISIPNPDAPATVFQDANGSWWYGAVQQYWGLYRVRSYYSYTWTRWYDCYYDNTFISYGCFWR